MISYNNHNSIKEIHYNNHSIKYVYGCGGNLVWSGDTPTPPTPSGYTDQPLTLVFEDSGTFKLNKSLQYSLDSGSSWTTLAAYTNSPTINTNQKVMLRREQVLGDDNSGTITASTFFHVEGNAYSLLYGEDFSGQTEMPLATNGRLRELFKGCSSLTNIDNLVLPATALTISAYEGMFSGCTSLSSVPTDLLPATTLTNGCYQSMFYNCSSLTTVPSGLLPSTTLAEKCYNGMFYGCSGLTTAPDLPALILTKTCYATMFFNCSNLNYIKCLARNIDAERCTQYWTGMISSTGTFVKNPLMSSWTTGVDGIPNGWTVQDA